MRFVMSDCPPVGLIIIVRDLGAFFTVNPDSLCGCLEEQDVCVVSQSGFSGCTALMIVASTQNKVPYPFWGLLNIASSSS
jgi:hypothetical protein